MGGDINAQVGRGDCEEYEDVMGIWGMKERNDKGLSVLEVYMTLAILQHSKAPAPPTMPLTIQPTQVPTTTGSTTRARTRSTEYHRRAYDLPSTKNLIEYLHCT